MKASVFPVKAWAVVNRNNRLMWDSMWDSVTNPFPMIYRTRPKEDSLDLFPGDKVIEVEIRAIKK